MPSFGRQHVHPSGQTGHRQGLVEPALVILLVWMSLELVRPSFTSRLPMLISLASLALWIPRKEKQLGRTGHWWFVMLAGMGLMIPFAINNYASFYGTQLVATLFLTHCLPVQSLLRESRDVRAWVLVFLGITVYIGAWAATHGGYGPAGAAGAQDENYVSALMTMAVPFVYFQLLNEKRFVWRVLLTAALVIFVAAIALADNASRGAFLALCCVGVYIVLRSPRKQFAVGILGVIGIALLVTAGPAFWAEIGTTAEFEEGTGDLRLRAWKGGFRMWLAHPILGVGPGNFTWQLGNYETALEVQELGRSLGGAMVAHSMWVELLADLGLVGVVATFALGWGAWSNLETSSREAARLAKLHPGVPVFAELQSMSYAVQCALLAIAVNGLVLSLLYFAHFWILVAVGNAMPYVVARTAGTHAGGGGAKRMNTGRGPPATARGRDPKHLVRARRSET